MFFVRVGWLLLALWATLPVALADSYIFYTAQNSSGQPVTFAAYETPQKACEATEGLRLSVGPPAEFVLAAEFLPATNQCAYRSETNVISIGPVVSAAGDCAGDVNFSFEFQQCVDKVDENQIHAVLLAFFLWSCLIGGLVVGERFAA